MRNLLLLVVLAPGILFSQNLIKDPGFEDVKFFPRKDKLKGIQYFSEHWYDGAPYIVCANVHQLDKKSFYKAGQDDAVSQILPHSGNTMIGLSTVWSGSIIGTLSEPLQRDSCYEISFWISLSKKSGISLDRFQVDFTDEKVQFLRNKDITKTTLKHKVDTFETIYLYKNLSQDFFDEREEWIQVKGIYKALGGEKFIRIGNYHETALYQISGRPAEKDSCNLKELKKLHRDIYKSKLHATGLYNYYYMDDVSLVKKSSVTDCMRPDPSDP